MAEPKPKPVSVRTMDQLISVVDDVVASNEPVPIELGNGRRVTVSSEPRSLAEPANGVAFTEEEIEERRRLFRSVFGAWSDIDAEALKKRIKNARSSNRPLVDFDH